MHANQHLYDTTTGKPLDKNYLGTNLPEYLQKSIDQYLQHIDTTLWDCFWCELCSDINVAELAHDITSEQAYFLRGEYLYDYEGDD